MLVCFDLLHFAGLNLRGAPTPSGAVTSTNACCPPPTSSSCTFPTMPSNSMPPRSRAGSRASSPSARTAPISRGGARPRWLKIKATKTAEFVIGGYTKGKGAREPLGAVLLGYWGKARSSTTPDTSARVSPTARQGTARAPRELDDEDLAVR